MRRLLRLSALALAFHAVTACAYVSAERVTQDSKADGIRYFELKPLLVVAGSTIDIKYVPNYSKPYALRWWTFLAKNDLTAEFSNGTLAKITSNQDTTAVTLALLGTVNKALETGRELGSAFSAATQGGAGKLQIFEILFDEKGGITGLRPLLTPAVMADAPFATNGGGGGAPNPPPPTGGKRDPK